MTVLVSDLKLALKALRKAEAALITDRSLKRIPNPYTDSALSSVRNAIKAFDEAIKDRER